MKVYNTRILLCAAFLQSEQVFLPAIAGHVPPDMVRCVAAFLDFCYLARRAVHTTTTLAKMDSALGLFHQFRYVFEDAGIRPDGFGLPRQHSLVHYTENIRLFGSLTGLDSSITESKHIRAVKEPWRESNRQHALGQMIVKNTRLSQMAALQVDFARRGMLPSVYVPGIEDDDDEILASDSSYQGDSDIKVSSRQGKHNVYATEYVS
jgi:hypothetical protein